MWFCLRALRVGGCPRALVSQYRSVSLSLAMELERSLQNYWYIWRKESKQMVSVRTAGFIFISIIFRCCWVVPVLSGAGDKGGHWHVLSWQQKEMGRMLTACWGAVAISVFICANILFGKSSDSRMCERNNLNVTLLTWIPYFFLSGELMLCCCSDLI